MLWSLLGNLQKLPWYGPSWATCSGCPCLRREVGPDALHCLLQAMPVAQVKGAREPKGSCESWGWPNKARQLVLCWCLHMEPSLQFITSASLHRFPRKRPCSSLCLLRVQKIPFQNMKTGHLPKAILLSTASEQPWHKVLYQPPLRKQPPKSKIEIKPFGFMQINREGLLREPSCSRSFWCSKHRSQHQLQSSTALLATQSPSLFLLTPLCLQNPALCPTPIWGITTCLSWTNHLTSSTLEQCIFSTWLSNVLVWEFAIIFIFFFPATAARTCSGRKQKSSYGRGGSPVGHRHCSPKSLYHGPGIWKQLWFCQHRQLWPTVTCVTKGKK